jgi:hypothetical protein
MRCSSFVRDLVITMTPGAPDSKLRWKPTFYHHMLGTFREHKRPWHGVSKPPVVMLSWNDIAYVDALYRLAAITSLTHLNFDVPLLQCNAVMISNIANDP